MKVTDQTRSQIERFVKKVAQKFPLTGEISMLTDIHVQVSQDSGEMKAFNDDEEEITRCVVEQWIDNKDEDFYSSVTDILRSQLQELADVIDNMGILKPYSFVLENEDNESIAELYVADDDTIIIGDDLMKNLDNDLNGFFDDLMKE